MGKLFVIGTGPGSLEHASQRAIDLLKISDSVAGYTTYIDLVKTAIADKKLISTGMMKEVDRVEAAIEEALEGKTCSLISGGDAGIYAMAGLVFELCEAKGIQLIRCPSESDHSVKTTSSPERTEKGIAVESDKGDEFDGAPPGSADQTNSSAIAIEVVPGIPALAAGASLLGAPLTHDFAVISLSDLLTPWDKIEKRLTAAAQADFVIAIYNPKSKKRDWQLSRAKELIMAHRKKDTPVGVVTAAMREDQSITITTLSEMDRADVGMQTILLVGNDSSLQYLDFMYTPRGYARKYNF